MYKNQDQAGKPEQNEHKDTERMLGHTLSRPLTDAELDQVSGACCSTLTVDCDDIAR